jgi:hypothetical protein
MKPAEVVIILLEEKNRPLLDYRDSNFLCYLRSKLVFLEPLSDQDTEHLEQIKERYEACLSTPTPATGLQPPASCSSENAGGAKKSAP